MDLGRDLQRVTAALLLLFGLMFAVGAVVLMRWGVLGGSGLTAIVGMVWLVMLGKPVEADAYRA